MTAALGFPTPAPSPIHMSHFSPFTSGLTAPMATAAPLPDVKIELENADLWQRFHQHTTEMIVTKTGRRMFPTLRLSISGLLPSESYAIYVELAPADDCRYKFQGGRWVVAGRAEPPLTSAAQRGRVYAHPDSPAPGRLWMRQAISFHRIKLTNNILDPQGHLLLNSMHKYQPRVYVLRLHECFPSVPQLVATASFAETAFIAVTAYQNERVIQLKIENNPFAKGFRENGLHADKKRPTSASPDTLVAESSSPKKLRIAESESEAKSPQSLVIAEESEQSTDTESTGASLSPASDSAELRSDEDVVKKPWTAPTPPDSQPPPSAALHTAAQPNLLGFSAGGAFSPLPRMAQAGLPSPHAFGHPPLGVGWPMAPSYGQLGGGNGFVSPAAMAGMLHPMVLAALAQQHASQLPAAYNPFLMLFRNN